MARSHRNNRKLVFTAHDEGALTPRFRGGKGYGLAFMRSLGLPVPPFFTISSSAGRAYLLEKRIPKRMMPQVKTFGIKALEKELNLQFGEFSVSVRSGAEVSMAGMMDTLMGVSNHTELLESIEHVFQSWNTSRAQKYREIHSVRDDMGTAVNIQVIVRGDKNHHSATGIALSHDTSTGEKGFFGEFLIQATGPELVGGTKTPMSIEDLSHWNPAVNDELKDCINILCDNRHAPVEVEWTVEDGKLWLLQCRDAKLEPQAKAAIAVEGVWDKRWDEKHALSMLSAREISSFTEAQCFEPTALRQAIENGLLVSYGTCASTGDKQGMVATSSEEAVRLAQEGIDVVLVRHDTDVDDLPGMHAAVAIVTAVGGATCHAAVNGRAMGKAVLTGCSNLPEAGMLVSVSASNGVIVNGILPYSTDKSQNHSKEVKQLLVWLENSLTETNCIDFSAVDRKLDANIVLAEFYLLEAMLNEGSIDEETRLKLTRHRSQFLNRVCPTFSCYLMVAVSSELRYVHRREFIVSGMREEYERILELGMKESMSRGNPYLLEIMGGRPVDQQIEFFTLSRRIFDNPAWGEVGFAGIGGEKWARISEVAEKYLNKEWGNVVFLDRLFNLRHNGGCIFDKHEMIRSRDSVLDDQLNIKHSFSGDLISLRSMLLGDNRISAEFEALWQECAKKVTSKKPYSSRQELKSIRVFSQITEVI